jgi:hypothetical protein
MPKKPVKKNKPKTKKSNSRTSKSKNVKKPTVKHEEVLGLRPNILEAEHRLKQLTSFEINTIVGSLVKTAKVRRRNKNTYE